MKRLQDIPARLAATANERTVCFAKALWLFLVGTVIGGIGVGLVFRGGLSELNRLAEPRHRGTAPPWCPRSPPLPTLAWACPRS